MKQKVLCPGVLSGPIRRERKRTLPVEVILPVGGITSTIVHRRFSDGSVNRDDGEWRQSQGDVLTGDGEAAG